jgi:hypothetical protein
LIIYGRFAFVYAVIWITLRRSKFLVEAGSHGPVAPFTRAVMGRVIDPATNALPPFLKSELHADCVAQCSGRSEPEAPAL